jgi:carboxypeptidase family protein
MTTSKAQSARITALAAVLVLIVAATARAQITTGSIAGTVKDVQAAVIPGVTVTLVNEAQGTRSAPVVTNADGDFVFANVSSGTYAIEIDMPSFKKLKRLGIVVSAFRRPPAIDPSPSPLSRWITCRSPAAASRRSPRWHPA